MIYDIYDRRTGAPPPPLTTRTTRSPPRSRRRSKEKKRKPWSCPSRSFAATTKTKTNASTEGSPRRARGPEDVAAAAATTMTVVEAAGEEAALELADGRRYGDVEADEVIGSVARQTSSSSEEEEGP